MIHLDAMLAYMPLIHPHEDIYAWSQREAWLAAALEEATAWAAAHGLTVPTVRLHPAMPLGYHDYQGYWMLNQRLPGVHRIYVSELLTTTQEALLVLLHELAHALAPGEKHGPVFAHCMKQLGVLWRRDSEKPDDALKVWLSAVEERLGPYPMLANRRARFLQPWDLYQRRVCWCPYCGQTAYKTPSSSNHRDFKNPLGYTCPASETPNAGHLSKLSARLPMHCLYPDLPPAERPDFQVELSEQPYFILPEGISQQPATHKVWGAFHVVYNGSSPWHRLAGLYFDRNKAQRLTQHLRGLNARSFDVREVALHPAEAAVGGPPNTLITVFDVKTNPLLVSAR
jgi:hypothetical protein